MNYLGASPGGIRRAYAQGESGTAPRGGELNQKEIKDNGKGLTLEEQQKLFKNFVRLHPKKADGYGLGLSIVKKIIEKLDGSVGIESNGDGNGSKLFFILPAVQQMQFIPIAILNAA